MGTSTFNGPVRSQNGFEVISTDSTTGTETTNFDMDGDGVVTSKYLQSVAHVTGVSVNTTAGNSPTVGTFTQPAGTLITDIQIICITSPVIGTGDIGYSVGTNATTGGGQVVAAVTDEILDGGTTVVQYNVTLPALVRSTESGTTAPASAQFSAAERSVYCNITNTVNATTAGSFTFIIKYVKVI